MKNREPQLSDEDIARIVNSEHYLSLAFEASGFDPNSRVSVLIAAKDKVIVKGEISVTGNIHTAVISFKDLANGMKSGDYYGVRVSRPGGSFDSRIN